MRKEMIQSMTLDKSVSIPHNWARSATPAMVITGGNCCEPER
jgi:hypothetical protein